MKTFSQTREAALKDRKWYVVDAAGLPLGRLAAEVAVLIRGKHKPTFTAHVDCGDFVVVVNADKVRLTGNKLQQKKYYHHSGYVGGLKEKKVADVLADNPDRVIRSAVKGMLPRGALGHQLINKLKIYSGSEHPHQAQAPEKYTCKYTRAA